MEKFIPRKSGSGPTRSRRKGNVFSAMSEPAPGLTSSVDEGFDRMSQVMSELDQLKKQSQRLDLLNQLHGRMAGILSLAAMIEAYSIWLMQVVDHELIGFHHRVSARKVLFCSTHGPGRRRALAFAEKILESGRGGDEAKAVMEGQLGFEWIFESLEDTSVLLIFRENSVIGPTELHLINDSLLVFGESLQRGIEYETLFEQASTDALTGLSNRRVFEERITAMMNCHNRYGAPLTMLCLDLDYFKQINDNLGHQAGDEVLRAVAGVLTSEVRATDLLVRMGGDEFLLVLDNTDRKQARILAERLVRRIDGLEVWANDRIKLGASIGLAERDGQESLKSWLERTDDLLYHAKIGGRSKVAADRQ